jgi:hypothetical protein
MPAASAGQACQMAAVLPPRGLPTKRPFFRLRTVLLALQLKNQKDPKEHEILQRELDAFFLNIQKAEEIRQRSKRK